MVKTKQIQDPQVFFDYLSSDDINVLDANLVSDDTMEIRYEYADNFIEADPKTNEVIADRLRTPEAVRRVGYVTGKGPLL